MVKTVMGRLEIFSTLVRSLSTRAGVRGAEICRVFNRWRILTRPVEKDGPAMTRTYPVNGVGLGLRRSMLDTLQHDPPSEVDFMEAAPENWIGVGGVLGRKFKWFTERYPFILHGLSLSIGSPADLVVLDTDVRTASSDEVHAAQVIDTFVDGEPVAVDRDLPTWID